MKHNYRLGKWFLALFLTGNSILSFAQEEGAVTTDTPIEDVFDLSLEDLMNVEVTSVSKKSERLQDVASSIYVLTSEDLKNTNATNLHEALRSIPGYWGTQDEYGSVSPLIRNSPAANGSRGTVLYLLDGTPLQDNMSSTFTFANFDIPIDEIDRIEVIRGSGGTVYGANSATGVVNIFTKNPEKYDGITARAEYAAPGYTNVTVRAGGKITEKLAISGYGKVRNFKGYGMLEEFKGDSIWVNAYDTTRRDDKRRVHIKNRFTEDFESSNMFSGGLKAVYKLSDKSKISLNTHFNSSQKKDYTNFDTDMSLLGVFGFPVKDSLVLNNVTRSRIVSNVKFDHEFSDKHSMFARVSSNMEKDFLKVLGGYNVNNSITDFEIQDNISLGKYNDLSVGTNFRVVKFDVYGINDQQGVAYVNPQDTKNLHGVFAQNKVKLFDGKLNFLVGMKAENYSLINSKYYLSPMAKVSFIPNENLTIWAGFTQSYTTPGYNNTNTDAFVAKGLPMQMIQGPLSPIINGMAQKGVYDKVYAEAKKQGADDATAKSSAEGYLGSPAGQAAVAGAVTGINKQLNTSKGVINGSKTVPTKYQTLEVGFRTNLEKVISFESNFYYSLITDAITASDTIYRSYYQSPAREEGVFGNYYLYGNYIKGVTYGTETMVKIFPIKGTQFEVSHVYTNATWEFQKNDDFDVTSEKFKKKVGVDQTPSTPYIPKHVVRFRASFQLPKKITFSTEVIYATTFATQARYEYDKQRYPNIIKPGGVTVAANNNRTIINFKIQKSLLNDKLNAYIFANDVFNEGKIAGTNAISNVTLSKIGPMVGLGATYKFM